MQDFRRVRVWRRAHELSLAIQRVTRAFPRSGYAELKSQLNRAADSIVSNIVEGCGAATRKEQARYLDISIKSASEVDYRLQLARDHGALVRAEWRPLANEVIEIRKMIYGFRRAILAADRAAEARRRPRLRRPTDD